MTPYFHVFGLVFYMSFDKQRIFKDIQLCKIIMETQLSGSSICEHIKTLRFCQTQKII